MGWTGTELKTPDYRAPWLKLAAISWLGDTLKAGLIKEFGDPDEVFRADRNKLSRVKGWTFSKLERFVQERKSYEIPFDFTLLEKKGIRIILFNEPEYPSLLRQIPDSPIVLYAMGKISHDSRPHISIVGARNASQMGFDIARQFSHDLAKAGFVIVSGLALGIDTFAHLGAAEAGGRTIAVLGCGVDVVYPSANRKTRQTVIESGMLLSEYPPGVQARPWNFPVRNRIISGISVGTLVIEASARSGSLITARLAGEQDREVFAVPGSIRSPLSEGTHALINDGAHMVTSSDDIIDHFSYLLPNRDNQISQDFLDDLSPDESRLLSVLSNSPVHFDQLLDDGRWKRDDLFSILLALEIRDYVIKYPGNYFQAKGKTPLRKVNMNGQ